MTENKVTEFGKVTDFENLYMSYLTSKSGRGFTKSSQKFQVAAFDGIYQIKRRLETKSYKVGKYNEFIISSENTRHFSDGMNRKKENISVR